MVGDGVPFNSPLVFPFKMTQRDGKVHEVYFRDHGLTNQTNNSYVAEVEVVDTSDCHSEDSGFEPRRSRHLVLVPIISSAWNTCVSRRHRAATDENQTRYIN